MDIVLASYQKDNSWKWISHYFPHLNWNFFGFSDNYRKQWQDLPLYYSIYQELKQKKKILVSIDPRLTARIGLFNSAQYHLAFGFNFPLLPKGVKKQTMIRAFKKVDRFTVFSSMEKELYHNYFNIPLEKIDMIHWGVYPINHEIFKTPIEKKGYICAIGGNQRDYKTLIEAAKLLPNKRFVIVARPDNLQGLDIPSNVSVYQNISNQEAMNILFFSEMMIVPLKGSKIPCGHVTLVAAMHLRKPFIITQSSGIEDYAIDQENSLYYQSGSAKNLKEKIEQLSQDQSLREKLSENGYQFALKNCSEEAIANYFQGVLDRITNSAFSGV